jgi:DNA-binding transcriptional ArsR family regulator
VHHVLPITRSLGDPTRLRALLALEHGELCLCQIIELLQLAPSTVSKHMNLLHDAGLVARRKDGRWAYYRLADPPADHPAREPLRWILNALTDDPTIADDRARLDDLRCRDRAELCVCYRTPTARPAPEHAP